MESRIDSKLINPEGMAHAAEGKVNPHPGNLEKKTIMLFWNGKHNGDVFLKRIGELLLEKVKNIEVIRSWEVAPETAEVSFSSEASKHSARKLADFKPAIVIGSTGD